MARPVSAQSRSTNWRDHGPNHSYVYSYGYGNSTGFDLELEASNMTHTQIRHEEQTLRASDQQNPFSASKLQIFYDLSDQAVETNLRLYRARSDDHHQFLLQDEHWLATTHPTATVTVTPTAAASATNSTLTATATATATGMGIHPEDHAAAVAAARRRRIQDDEQWKVVKQHAGITVKRHVQRRGKMTSLLAQGLVRGSLTEVLDGLYAETTKEARVVHSVLGETFVDAAVLHVDSYRTTQHPYQFAGVTWMAVETPRGGYGMCKDRDFLLFKKMGTCKDDDGEELGYLTLQTIDVGSDSPLATTPHCVRGALSFTAFFRPRPNGLVELFVQGDFNARGHLASRLADKMFAQIVFAFARAPQSGQAKSLAVLLQSVSANQLPPGGVLGHRGGGGGGAGGGGEGASGASGGGQVFRLFPKLAERTRDRCGVCSKTLWKVLETPEFCRSCWTRTCRTCRATMPVYCADFHRTHDEDSAWTSSCPSSSSSSSNSVSLSSLSSGRRSYTRRRIPRPCQETFCLKCVCSVLPNGIKVNARLLKQIAKKNKRAKKITSRTTSRTSGQRRGMAPSSAGSSALSGLGGRVGTGTGGSGSRSSRHQGASTPSSAHQGSGGSSVPQVLVRLPRRNGSRLGYMMMMNHHDDLSSISVLSSVESDKHRQRRFGVSTAANTFTNAQHNGREAVNSKALEPVGRNNYSYLLSNSLVDRYAYGDDHPVPATSNPKANLNPSHNHNPTRIPADPHVVHEIPLSGNDSANGKRPSMLAELANFELSQLDGAVLRRSSGEHRTTASSVSLSSASSHSVLAGAEGLSQFGGVSVPPPPPVVERKLRPYVNLTPRKRRHRHSRAPGSVTRRVLGSDTSSHDGICVSPPPVDNKDSQSPFEPSFQPSFSHSSLAQKHQHQQFQRQQPTVIKPTLELESYEQYDRVPDPQTDPMRQGPGATTTNKQYDDEYYYKVLQRYLDKRRASRDGSAASISLRSTDFLDPTPISKTATAAAASNHAALFNRRASIGASVLRESSTTSASSHGSPLATRRRRLGKTFVQAPAY